MRTTNWGATALVVLRGALIRTGIGALIVGVFRSGVDECPYCHAPVERKERVIREQDGELQQIDVEAIKRERKREQQRGRPLVRLRAGQLRASLRRRL